MKYLFSLFIILLFSCNDFVDTWEGWEIKKGEHKSQRTGLGYFVPRSINENRIIFDAQFVEGMYYQPAYDDLNKLYGFCDCNSTVHENSVRFAWKHQGDSTIGIYTYLYVEGKRKFEKIGETVRNRVDHYEIIAKGDSYIFIFNGERKEYLRSRDCKHGVRIRLTPYFGGNNPAPKNQLILIKEYK